MKCLISDKYDLKCCTTGNIRVNVIYLMAYQAPRRCHSDIARQAQDGTTISWRFLHDSQSLKDRHTQIPTLVSFFTVLKKTTKIMQLQINP